MNHTARKCVAVLISIGLAATSLTASAQGTARRSSSPTSKSPGSRKTLADNKDVRWTFVFMHQPLWDNPEPTESWKQIDAALQNREFTFFAGHTHYYDYDLINGHEYITVGPSGAGFTQDGPGNVDMLTWVTMKKDGPEFAGIALKGLFDRKGLDPKMFGATTARRNWAPIRRKARTARAARTALTSRD